MWNLSESQARASGAFTVPEGGDVIADILEKIRPGIRNDPEQLEACFVMLDMGRGVRDPDKSVLARFKDDLGRLDTATWLPLVDRARAKGYRLPIDPSELAAIVDEVAAMPARPRTVRPRRLAHDCVSVYMRLTGKRPQVINAKQLGHGDRLYYQLVEATFGRERLPNWQDRAYEAARDLKSHREDEEIRRREAAMVEEILDEFMYPKTARKRRLNGE